MLHARNTRSANHSDMPAISPKRVTPTNQSRHEGGRNNESPKCFEVGGIDEEVDENNQDCACEPPAAKNDPKKTEQQEQCEGNIHRIKQKSEQEGNGVGVGRHGVHEIRLRQFRRHDLHQEACISEKCKSCCKDDARSARLGLRADRGTFLPEHGSMKSARGAIVDAQMVLRRDREGRQQRFGTRLRRSLPDKDSFRANRVCGPNRKPRTSEAPSKGK